MSKNLIIVESPTKCKTITKILGKDFIVKSTVGHIRDLPKYRMGIDFDNNFAPNYEIDKKKSRVIKELKEAIKQADTVYIATDEDREGEAIGWHVIEIFDMVLEKTSRITFHEITPIAIKDSFNNARRVNMDLVDAQQARRLLDRIVGYTLSPLLSKKIYKGLSAGRVQSVAVKLIVDREREIEKFKKDEYWTIKADLSKKDTGEMLKANLVAKDSKKFKKLDIKTDEQAQDLIKDIDKKDFVIKSAIKKERKKNPLPPFITSSLQQTASRNLGISAKQTMFVAQSLYEGISLGDKETVGLITYMRTDSFNIAKEACDASKKYIKENFGDEYIPDKPKAYKSKVKNAQEAHECIRPTNVFYVPESIKMYLDRRQFLVYKLIWERFLASQMKEARIEQNKIEIESGDLLWQANGARLVFPGYKKIYNDEKDDDNILPEVHKDEILNLVKVLPEQHFTEPPPRYNEAALIKALEAGGVGRPSTYASIISTILLRGYVTLEKRKFFPEESAMLVTELLEKHFPDIVSIDFTANMEENLDKIGLGEMKWQDVLKDFYDPFIKNVKESENKIRSRKVNIEIDKDCPKCGSKLAIKSSRFGRFLACTSFPKCKYTESFITDDKQKENLGVCPNCKGELAVKHSRYGEFIACSNYPKCKFSKSKDAEDIEKKCPECGKLMAVKFSKRGKFLGCTGYPDCKHVENLPKKEKNDREDKV